MLVATIDLTDLLPRLDGRVGVAQLRLANAGDVAKLRLARLGRYGRHAGRSEQHVFQVRVLSLLTQLLLDERERLGIRGVEAKSLTIFCQRLRLTALQVLRLGLGEQRLKRRCSHGRWLRHRRRKLLHGVGRRRCRSFVGTGRRGTGEGRLTRGGRAEVRKRLGSEETVRIRRKVGGVLRSELGSPLQLLAVVVGELHRAVMPWRRDERLHGVVERVIDVPFRVHFGQRDEEMRRLVALRGRNGLVRPDPLDDGLSELHRERGIVGSMGAGASQRLGRSGEIQSLPARLGLLAEESHLALDVVDERLLHREVRDGLSKALRFAENPACSVDRVSVLRIELREPAVANESTLRLRKRRLRPKATELVMNRRKVALHIGAAREHRLKLCGNPFEERCEPCEIGLVPIELRQVVDRCALCRIALEGVRRRPRGSGGITDRRPHVRRLA